VEKIIKASIILLSRQVCSLVDTPGITFLIMLVKVKVKNEFRNNVTQSMPNCPLLHDAGIIVNV
jgi:hypothetical protein